MAIPPVQPFSQQPGGGLVTAMQGMNALSRSNLENQIKSAEAQYAPWTQYANALSKIAYSQFVGPQTLAALVNDPKIRGMLTEDQYKNFLNQFSNQLGSGNAISQVPVPNQPSSSGSILGNIFSRLFGSSNVPSMQNLPRPTNNFVSPQMTSNAPQTTGDYGLINKASPEFVQSIIDHGNQGLNQNQPAPTVPVLPSVSQVGTNLSGTSPLYARESSKLPKGVMAAENPSAITAAGEAALKTGSETQAKLIQDQWKAREDEIRDQMSGAQEMERQLNRLSFLRDKLSLWEKGPGLGSLPGISDAAQEYDTVTNNLVAAKLKAWQSSRITNMDIGFGQTLKPSRYMGDTAFQHEKNYELGLSSRLQESAEFNDMAKRIGLTPNQADAIWTRYANEMPFYDPKTGKVLDKNLGMWEQYLTPKNIQETFSPSYRKKMNEYRKNMAGGNPKEDKKIVENYNEGKKAQNENSVAEWPKNKDAINEKEVEGKVPPKNTKWMIRPDGMKVPVHKSNVARAKQLNYRDV